MNKFSDTQVEEKLRLAISERRYEDALLYIYYFGDNKSPKSDTEVLTCMNAYLQEANQAKWSYDDLDLSQKLLFEKGMIEQ